MVVDCGSVTLNNGTKMPLFGLGTFLSEPGKVQSAVEAAIDAGYRHIDCAHFYFNEHEVGQAIRNKIEEGVVQREDLFVTSKLWNNAHRPECVEAALDVSLKNLGLDYVNLYLMHWPMAFNTNNNLKIPFMKDDNKTVIMDDDAHYVDTWKKFEELYTAGEKLKAIGVSNFNLFQLKKILSEGTVVPHQHQIELHAYNQVAEMVDFCQSNGIQVTAYSSLGAPARLDMMKIGQPVLMEDSLIQELAKKYGKSAAQVLLRWVTQRKITVLPKSVTPSRIVENSNIFDFEIDADDMERISGLDKGCRYLRVDIYAHSRFYPFNENYNETQSAKL